MTSEEEDRDKWVIRGSNLVAQVDTGAHSDLVVKFFEQEGLAASSEHGAHADARRIHISGHAEKVDHAVEAFREQHPQIPLHIVGTEATDA